MRLTCFVNAMSMMVCCGGFAQAALPTYDFTITAGTQDRQQAPVRIPLTTVSLPDFPKNSPVSVILQGPDGRTITAQLTQPGLLASKECWREIHFILPQLKSGETLSLKATLSGEPSEAQECFTWLDKAGEFALLRFGERPVLRYHYEAYDESTKESRDRTYKVFHHVFSPLGDRIVTNGLLEDPQVHSPHHRGIFYGFNRISYGAGKTADTWHCFFDGSYQEHDRFLASEAGPVLGRHRVVIRWHGQDKQAFATEERELTVYHVPGGHLIEFASRLRTNGGPVRMDGDPQHAGFQFRAHNDVDAYTKQETIYIRPDGVGQPGETRNWDPTTGQGPVNLPWNAMSFVLGGKRYTTAYLDHPKNPKEARFSERDYGRFGSYFEYTIEPERPLNTNYRLWLQDGLMTPEQVARLSTDFVQPVGVTVTAR